MDKKSLEHTLTPGSCLMEQVTGIEPALSAWEAEVLPLHHTCKFIYYYTGLWAESPSWDMPQVRAFFKKEYKMQIF